MRKSPSPVKNGKVRRVKISLTETKQGSALKTEILSGAIPQKQFYFYSSLLRLAKHQFEKSGLNLVLEYEKGGECTQSDATDFELFSISLHFPNPTLKTLSALAEKRNNAEVLEQARKARRCDSYLRSETINH